MEPGRVELLDHVQHEPHQMVLGQPVRHVRRQQELLIPDHRAIRPSHPPIISRPPTQTMIICTSDFRNSHWATEIVPGMCRMSWERGHMLRVSLLGERTVTDEATGEVRSRSSRTLALIAYLAVHAGSPNHAAGSPPPSGRASPEQQALTNLRRELHQLRRTVDGDESLLVTGTDLTWRDRDTCRVDLRDFQRARERALAAAPGDAERTSSTARPRWPPSGASSCPACTTTGRSPSGTGSPSVRGTVRAGGRCGTADRPLGRGARGRPPARGARPAGGGRPSRPDQAACPAR